MSTPGPLGKTPNLVTPSTRWGGHVTLLCPAEGQGTVFAGPPACCPLVCSHCARPAVPRGSGRVASALCFRSRGTRRGPRAVSPDPQTPPEGTSPHPRIRVLLAGCVPLWPYPRVDRRCRAAVCTHAHMLTHAHTCVHMLTHAHARAHMLTHAHTRVHTRTHAHTCSRTLTPPHAVASSLLAAGPLSCPLPQPSSVSVGGWGRAGGHSQLRPLHRGVHGLCRPAVQPRGDPVANLRRPGGVRGDGEAPGAAGGGAGQGLRLPGTVRGPRWAVATPVLQRPVLLPVGAGGCGHRTGRTGPALGGSGAVDPWAGRALTPPFSVVGPGAPRALAVAEGLEQPSRCGVRSQPPVGNDVLLWKCVKK